METPKYHLTNEEMDTVYEPSEDSFLLIDALEEDLELLIDKNPSMCLEIGIGSGIVITALAMALKEHCSSCFYGIDINPQACKVAKKVCAMNEVDIDIVQTDLLNNFCVKNMFDIILFNPPYVVTEPLEVYDDRLISKAWAGGHKGRQVMDRLFPLIPDLLSRNGLFYLVVIQENEPEEIIEFFKGLNMIGSITMKRKIRGERLSILRFQKKSN